MTATDHDLVWLFNAAVIVVVAYAAAWLFADAWRSRKR
jgi:hypothetical protein